MRLNIKSSYFQYLIANQFVSPTAGAFLVIPTIRIVHANS